MKKELLDLLETKLKMIDKYTNGKEILKNKVIEDILKLDKDILEIITSEPKLKEAFTINHNGMIIVDKVKLQSVISSENFLPNSYTKYKNKIGLFVGTTSISNNDDVVLNWAYKDCVLEGGQTKDTQSSDEVFFNEVIGADDIDTMTSPKVLTNFKKYNKEGASSYNGDINPTKDNLIIKGNNLLTLHSIKENYKNMVKLIYIDVPYNTKNDSFRYNDSFTHSTWLTFMKNRLDIAKEFLHEEGAICIQCDDTEHAYLKVLCDELFGRNNFINDIIVKAKSGAGASGGGEDKRFKKNIEYILIYAKNKELLTISFPAKEKLLMDIINEKRENKKSYEYTSILFDEGTISYKTTTKDGSNEDIIIYKHDNYSIKTISQVMEEELLSEEDVYKKYINKIFRATNAQTSIRTRVNKAINYNKELHSINYIPKSGKKKGISTVNHYLNGDLICWLKDTTKLSDDKIIKLEKLGTLWDDISWNGISAEGGVTLSNGKKPEKLIKRIIECFTSENDIVMDFFMGSGTTCAVAHKMNRHYVGIEQMDYIEELAITRLKNVIKGDQSGISKSVNWTGGGEFIYCELKQLNQKYIDLILKCEDENMLNSIYEMILNNAFVHYTVEVKEIDTSKELFTELNLNEKRAMLIQILDKNMLYVNYSDIQDITFNISDSDKIANNLFYQKGE